MTGMLEQLGQTFIEVKVISWMLPKSEMGGNLCCGPGCNLSGRTTGAYLYCGKDCDLVVRTTGATFIEVKVISWMLPKCETGGNLC